MNILTPNIYNKFKITEYQSQWKISSNIIYASRQSIVYSCRPNHSGCLCQHWSFFRRSRFVAKIASYSENEQRCLTTLTHPHIVKSIDIYHNKEGMVIIFPYYPYGDLMDVLNKQKLGRIDKELIVNQLINVIAFLHGQGIAHGDLKLENILMERNPHWMIKLADFGLSVYKKTRSPNQEEDPTQDPFAFDVWNLGLVLLHIYHCSIDQQYQSQKSTSNPSLTTISLTSYSENDEKDEKDENEETLLVEVNPFRELIPHLLDKDQNTRWTIFQCQKWLIKNKNLRQVLVMSQSHITWDEYFMGLALLSAQRSKDPNSKVGACIVNSDHKIVGIGYNGFPTGISDSDLPWKREGEFLETKYPYVCHAEMNAILNSNQPQPLKHTVVYVTLFPCNECTKFIIQSRIEKIYYLSDKYRDTDSTRASKLMLDKAGITYEPCPVSRKDITLSFSGC